MNGKREPVTPEPDLHLLGHARYHPDLSRAFGNLSVKRLGCIFFDIEKHLQQLLTVTPECWNRNVIVPDKREPLRKLSQNDLPDPLQHFVDVDVRKRPPRAVRGARRLSALGLDELKRMGVVLKRAQYFITCRGFSGAHPGRGSAGRERITRALIDPNVFSAGAEQLSMFAPPAVDRLVEQGVPPRAAQRMVREEAVQCLARAL